MNSIRKSGFLLTTAMLLAGVGLASAQGMREGAGGGGMGPGGGTGGGAAEHGKSGGGMTQGPAGASRGEGMTQGRATEPRAGGRAESPARQPGAQRSEGMRDSGRAADKAEKGQRQLGKDQSQRGQKDQAVGQGRGDRDQARQSESAKQHQSESAKQKGQATTQGTTTGTSAQGQRGEKDTNKQTGAPAKGQSAQQGQSTTTTGANTRGQSNAPAQGQTTQQGQGATTGTQGQNVTQGQTNAPAQSQGAAAQSMSGRVSVNAQQQTTLQQSVLSSRNVARVNASSINFRINTGVVVPRHISVVSIATYPVLIDLFPTFRDDSFFVVDDEIVVLDRSRRVVDVVPAGPRTRFSRAGSMGGGSVAALNLSPEEIRVVQEVLIERRLLTGEVTGVFDARTREALITFQRQKGFRATGTIDTRTVAALGVSNRISATQNQSTTTGQGQAAQQPSAQQNTTGQNTGQANAPAQQSQPATTGQAQQNQPATTGQAGSQQPPGQTTGQAAPPAQGTNPPSANQNMPSAQPNQNNAPSPSTTGQPAQNPPNK